MNRARRKAEHAVRVCERFVYSIVIITRSYDYKTWQTQFWRNSRGAFKKVARVFLFCFWLDCIFGSQTLSISKDKGKLSQVILYSQGPVEYRMCYTMRPLSLRTMCVTQVWSRRVSNTMIDLFQRALEQEIS